MSAIRQTLYSVLVNTLVLSVTLAKSDEPINVTLAYRLPIDLIPLHYELHVDFPYPETEGEEWKESYFNFTGTVVVTLRCDKPTSVLIMHQRLTNISVDKFQDLTDGTNMTNFVMETHNETETIAIELGRDMVVGHRYQTTLSFTGEVTIDPDSSWGLYASSYRDHHNRTQYVIMTKLEAVEARLLFPCFDEPNFKSTYKIHVILPGGRDLRAVSNMEEVGRFWAGDDKQKVRTEFFSTEHVMPVYLVSIVVGRLVIEPVVTTNRGIKILPWTTEKSGDKLSHASQYMATTVNYLEDYFDIHYPMKHLGFVALPGTKTYGALENWGLILFTAGRVEYEEQAVTDYFQLSTVGHLTAHEVSHQWVGNLVTVEFWDDMWIQEGLTTYIETKARETFISDDHESQLAILLQRLKLRNQKYSKETTRRAMKLVILEDTDVGDVFDRVIYYKGAAMFRMLEQLVGGKIFQRSMRKYMKENAFKSVISEDLWQVFDQELLTSSRSVELRDKTPTTNELMNRWGTQNGFPLVEIVRNYSACPNTNTIIFTVSQSEFQVDNDSKRIDMKNGTIWPIPLWYRTLHGKTGEHSAEPVLKWITTESESSPTVLENAVFNVYKFNSRIPQTLPWVSDIPSKHYGFIDLRDTFYFRTLCTTYYINEFRIRSCFEEIGAYQIEFYQLAGFSVLEKGQLIDDAFALAETGIVAYNIAFDLATYLDNEFTDFLPLESFMRHFLQIRRRLGLSEEIGVLNRYVQVLKPLNHASYESFGMRSSASSYKEALTKKKGIKEILCVGMRSATQELWETIRELAKLAKNHIETPERRKSFQTVLRDSLTCTEAPWIVPRLLYSLPSEDNDLEWIWSAISDSPVNARELWYFLIDHGTEMDKYIQKFNMTSDDLTAMVTTATSWMTSADQLETLNLLATDWKTRFNETFDQTETSAEIQRRSNWYNTYHRQIRHALSEVENVTT